MAFLPVTADDVKAAGWDAPDFILISGDAYVDHPSFGPAIISRLLGSHGYKVAILAQPDHRNADAFRALGRPRLGFLISAGNMDSMVANYTVFKRRRREDKYSPGGQPGRRPDRAAIVYAARAREAFRDVPVTLGGIEASLRRLAHYDYWEDKVRRSILLDAKADLLVYGMGEKPIVEIAEALEAGIAVRDIQWIRGTVWRCAGLTREALEGCVPGLIFLPPYDAVSTSPASYAESFRIQYRNNDPFHGRPLAEGYHDGVFIVQNPPAEILSEAELDRIYELPYEGRPHPMYDGMSGVPAIEEVRFSITANRGCFGGCAFCALAFHQGRIVQGRSMSSIVAEAQRLTQEPDFRGYIHDIGGPTANFRKPACKGQLVRGMCPDRDCLVPKPCPDLEVDHADYLEILRAVRELPGVRRVFIRSGIRYDYALCDPDSRFIEELCRYHVSGSLKVAPEHVSRQVLAKMRKPPIDVYERFAGRFTAINKRLGKKQYLVPYFISSHPGSTLKDAVELAVYLKRTGFIPDQVQDFYPTPGTLSTCMYHTGIDPLTNEKVYCARDVEEKKMQRALLQFNKPENGALVRKALFLTGRGDLVGYGPGALIQPERRASDESAGKAAASHGKKQGGIPKTDRRKKRS